jgi:hypothetical protein
VEAVNNLAQNINTTSANLSGGPNICNIQKWEGNHKHE